MTVQFHLKGPSLTIASLDYGDTLAQASSETRRAQTRPTEQAILALFHRALRVRAIRPLYLSTGNLRVRFAAPVVRFAGDPNHTACLKAYPSKSPSIPAPSSIFGHHLGRQSALDTTALNSLATVQPGELADGMKLAGLWQRVKRIRAQRLHRRARQTSAPIRQRRGHRLLQRRHHRGPAIPHGRAGPYRTLARCRKRASRRVATPPGKSSTAPTRKTCRQTRKAIGGNLRPLPMHYDKLGHFLRADQRTQSRHRRRPDRLPRDRRATTP